MQLASLCRFISPESTLKKLTITCLSVLDVICFSFVAVALLYFLEMSFIHLATLVWEPHWGTIVALTLQQILDHSFLFIFNCFLNDLLSVAL